MLTIEAFFCHAHGLHFQIIQALAFLTYCEGCFLLLSKGCPISPHKKELNFVPLPFLVAIWPIAVNALIRADSISKHLESLNRLCLDRDHLIYWFSISQAGNHQLLLEAKVIVLILFAFFDKLAISTIHLLPRTVAVQVKVGVLASLYALPLYPFQRPNNVTQV